MITGRLERLTAGGYAEGWAFESLSPERPLTVDIRVGAGDIVAEGLANLYRDDLANARLGLGWCAFRLRLAPPSPDHRDDQPLALHDKGSGRRIDFALDIPVVSGDGFEDLGQDVVGFNPFVIEDISQLRACEELFARFIRTKGASGFVRAASMYVLGRHAGRESLALDAEMLRKGKVTAIQLLEMLTETAEYRVRPTKLAAPNAPGFPFVEPAYA